MAILLTLKEVCDFRSSSKDYTVANQMLTCRHFLVFNVQGRDETGIFAKLDDQDSNQPAGTLCTFSIKHERMSY